MSRVRWLRRVSGVAGGVAVAGAAFGSYVERPFAEVEDGKWYDARGQTIPVEGPGSGGRVVDRAGAVAPNRWTAAGASLARAVVVPVVAAIGHAALRARNHLEVEGEGRDELVELVRHRERGVGLLTVSNHSSVLDDPFLLGALLPLPLALDARRARWGACSQEVCFSRGALASAFFGAGKTIPIKRGGGVDQRGLAAAATKLAKGDWVHVFPEGHVHQAGTIGSAHAPVRVDSSSVGGRGSHDNERDAATKARIGALKWGTAKLIAHAPTPVLVVPLVHEGMHRLMPYGDDGKCESLVPRAGQSVGVRVGRPIAFDDLLSDHERRTGHPLRRYGPTEADWFPSSAADRELYTRISRRLEANLVALHAAHHLSRRSR